MYTALRPSHATSNRLNNHRHWALDIRLERPDQFRSERAVDGAVIGRERYLHLGRDRELAVAHHGTLFSGADGENGRMGRVDHGGKLLNAVHAEIGDRRRAALILL